MRHHVFKPLSCLGPLVRSLLKREIEGRNISSPLPLSAFCSDLFAPASNHCNVELGRASLSLSTFGENLNLFSTNEIVCASKGHPHNKDNKRLRLRLMYFISHNDAKRRQQNTVSSRAKLFDLNAAYRASSSGPIKKRRHIKNKRYGI